MADLDRLELRREKEEGGGGWGCPLLALSAFLPSAISVTQNEGGRLEPRVPPLDRPLRYTFSTFHLFPLSTAY